MFLFQTIPFLKFLVKSQPQRFYEKRSYKKRVCADTLREPDNFLACSRFTFIAVMAQRRD